MKQDEVNQSKSIKPTNKVKLLSCFTLQEQLKEFFCGAINEILNDCIMHSSYGWPTDPRKVANIY